VTLGQFFLGLVTLVVATAVYSWQRGIDRRTELQRERRQLYGRYLEATHRHYFSQPFVGLEFTPEQQSAWEGFSDSELECYILRDLISLNCPEDVYSALDQYDRAMRSWKIAFTSLELSDKNRLKVKELDKEMDFSRYRLAEAMRKDLESHGALRISVEDQIGRLWREFGHSKD
jgi:hypothetical protein